MKMFKALTRFTARRRLLLLALVCGIGIHEAGAQLSLQISQLQLRYRVLRRTTRLDEAKEAELRKLEEGMLGARTGGWIGLAYRDLNEGLAILEGKPWTTAEEFAATLTLTTDMTVCDPTRPLVARIGQCYPAQPQGKPQLSAHVSLGNAPAAATQPGARRLPGKALGEFSGFPSDLMFEPFRIAADLGDAKDGHYQLQVEVRDGKKSLHRIGIPLFIVHDFDTKHAAIEQRLAAVNGLDPIKDSIRYPFDLARTLNLGRMSIPTYDFAAGMVKSEALLTAIETGKDPFAGERGILERHYYFEAADEIMPYRVFVPKSYDGSKAYPLIIALHGLGGTEATFMQGHGGTLPKLAEEHGYLVAAPLGYRRNGGYGRTSALLPADDATARMARFSEEDVMNVLDLMRKNYQVDPDRIYLMGHSMGGGGTWNLGTKYAEIWAALGPIAGGGAASSVIPLENLKENDVPVIVVHGDADRTVPVEGSRTLVAEMKQLGIPHEYIEVTGGGHSDVVAPNLPRIVGFFDRHMRAKK